MLIRDFVVEFERLILLAELFNNAHVLTHYVRDELCRTSQLSADKDEAVTEVAELFAFHVH